MKSEPTTTPASDDPIAEIHEIRRRLAAEHGNDPRRLSAYLRQRQKARRAKVVRVEKQLVPARTED